MELTIQAPCMSENRATCGCRFYVSPNRRLVVGLFATARVANTTVQSSGSVFPSNGCAASFFGLYHTIFLNNPPLDAGIGANPLSEPAAPAAVPGSRFRAHEREDA